jgi:ankyrin repeat protein
MTPLHWACKRYDKQMVEFLLNFDACENAEDIFGRTPYSIA